MDDPCHSVEGEAYEDRDGKLIRSPSPCRFDGIFVEFNDMKERVDCLVVLLVVTRS